MNNTILEKIEKLAALKEKGVLTDEEFESKKKILLELVGGDSVQNPVSEEDNITALWMSIVAFIFGLFAFMASLDDTTGWDKDTIIGMIIFVGFSVSLGVASLVVSKKNATSKVFSIIAIVLSILGVLIAVAN